MTIYKPRNGKIENFRNAHVVEMRLSTVRKLAELRLLDFPSVQDLWVERCVGLENIIGTGRALRRLKVEHCKNLAFSNMVDMPELRCLELAGGLKEVALEDIVAFPLLEELTISRVAIKGGVPVKLALPRLKKVFLEKTDERWLKRFSEKNPTVRCKNYKVAFQDGKRVVDED